MFPKKRNSPIQEGAISTIEKIPLGGVEQTILIQGFNGNHPVLLFLHGGPSMPIPGVGCRLTDYAIATTTKELVKHFVVVFWDQRGTGKSYHPSIPKESMNVEQFVSDANDLVDYLRNRFDQERIFLAGHSWGTVIGLHLASRNPEKFFAYVGISQIVSWAENDRLSFEWALDKARLRGNKKALKELTAIGKPPYTQSFQQWGILRKWQMKFKSMVFTDESIKHPGVLEAVKIWLASPDYTLLDIFHSFYSGFKLSYTQQMIEDFSRIDFRKSVTKMEIPVYFVHGRKDVHVHGKLVEDYLDGLTALNGKHLLWVEKSSHMLHPDDAKEVEKLLINLSKIIKSVANRGYAQRQFN